MNENTMTVGGLIELLKQYPADMEVYGFGYGFAEENWDEPLTADGIYIKDIKNSYYKPTSKKVLFISAD